MGKRYALLLGVSRYIDERLQELESPKADIKGLGEVFANPEIGNFDFVETFLDLDSAEAKRIVHNFFSDKKTDDLVLVYFSGHGVVDAQGNLFLATKDTNLDRFRNLSLSTKFLLENMESSFSQRQVLILDCCFSGAFARNSKIGLGKIAVTGESFQGDGRGKIILTATDATQYAWDGKSLVGKSEKSLFTHYLIEGLQSGFADLNDDSEITLDELYDYTFSKVAEVANGQRPKKWIYSQEGKGVIIGYAQRINIEKIESFGVSGSGYEYLAISPDGNYLAAISRNEPRLAVLDVMEKQVNTKLLKLQYQSLPDKILHTFFDLLSGTIVNGVEISPDSKYVIVNVNGIRVLDIKTLEQVGYFRVSYATYLSKNEIMLTATGKISIFNIESKENSIIYERQEGDWNVSQFLKSQGTILGILMTNYVATKPNDDYVRDHRLLVFDVTRKKFINEISIPGEPMSFRCTLSPNGEKFAILRYHTIIVYDTRTSKELYRMLPEYNLYFTHSIKFITNEIIAIDIHDSENKDLGVEFYRGELHMRNIGEKINSLIFDANQSSKVFASLENGITLWKITSAGTHRSIYDI